MGESDFEVPGVTDLEPVAVGGNSVVYRGRQPSMDRFVAVKVLSQSGETIRRRFDREQKAMGRLSRHPGVVTVYETGYAEDGRPYLVMPWIDGGSVQDRLDASGPIPWQEAVEATARVAETLQAAHESGVVHADIKPANLLVDSDGRFLITDFGIASVSDFAHTKTSSSAFTPHYAAPELIAGDRPTAATDLYGLAATLYAMVNCRPPFQTDGDLVALAGEIASASPPVLGVEIPAEVEVAYQRAMAKSPRDRFRNAHEFSAALRLDASPLSTTPVTVGRGSRRWLWATLAAALVVVAVGVGAVLPSRSGTEGPTEAGAATAAPTTLTTSVAPQTSASPVPTTAPPPSTLPETTESVPAATEAPATVPPFEDATIQEIPVGGSPQTPVLFDGFVWIARDDDDGGSTVLRLNAGSGAVADTISIDGIVRGPAGVDGVAWFHNVTEGTLVGIEAATGNVVDTIRVSGGRSPNGSVAGQDLNTPVAAVDGTIWVSLNVPVEVLRVDVTTREVVSLPVLVDTASQPIAGVDSVWFSGRALCIDGWSQHLPDTSWHELGIPVYSQCSVISRYDLATSTLGMPTAYSPWLRWIDPESSVDIPACRVDDPSNCRRQSVSGRSLYDERLSGSTAPEWYFPAAGNAYSTYVIPADVADAQLWVTTEGPWNGATAFVESDEQKVRVFCLTDTAAGALVTLSDNTLWLTDRVSARTCAVDLDNLPPPLVEKCYSSDHCVPVAEAYDDGTAYEIQVQLPDELGTPLNLVSAGFGPSVWMPLLDGTLLLLEFGGDSEIRVAASFDIGLGIGLPLVAADGSVWVPSAGRVTRIVPTATPADFAD